MSAVKNKQKLKVIHLIESLGSGGAERLLYTNLKHLDRNSLENEVITIFSDVDYWKKPIEEFGIRVSSLECASNKNILKGISRLRKKIREIKPDVIHTHLWTANIIGRIAGRLEKVPVISSIHSIDYEIEAISDGSDITPLKRFVIRNLDKWTAIYGCRRMIAVSQYAEESVAQRLKFPAEKIDVLYNPIDIEALQPNDSLSKAELLTSIGLPPDSVILLNVARISPQKGLIYAIQAMSEVKRKFPQTHLVALGALNDEVWLAKLRSEIKRLNLEDSVHLLGARRDVAEFLHHSDIFVFPSLHEGLGIALIEAMAVGCACIASDVRPISEFIENQENGLLVAPKNPKELAVGICSLLGDENKRKLIGERALQTALARFQPQPAADILAETYHSVARPEKTEI